MLQQDFLMLLLWMAYVYAVPAFSSCRKLTDILIFAVRPAIFFFYNSVAVFIIGGICATFIPFNSELMSGAGNEFEFVWLGFLSGAMLAAPTVLGHPMIS
jgi:hypothetical protein